MTDPGHHRLFLYAGILFSAINLVLIVFILFRFVLGDGKQQHSTSLKTNIQGQNINDIYSTSFLKINPAIRLADGSDSILLHDHLEEEYSLFYCFSSTDCRECVFEEIKLLNNIFSYKESSGISIIMRSDDQFYYPNRAYLGSRYFETSERLLPNIDLGDKSYFVVIQTATLQSGLLFYPDKNQPRQTVDYLINIKKRFFSH